MTPSATTMNANSVPMLVSSSAWSWVTNVGASPTKTPVRIVPR